MVPARILVGSVPIDTMGQNVNDRREITFREQRGISALEEKTEAVLVVLEPTQSPKEVAETILWALR